MAVKQVWAMAPKQFTTTTGKKVMVGIKTTFNTGKVYKGTGARERQRAEKRKAKRELDESSTETDPR